MIVTFVSYIYPYPERGFNPGIERVVEEYSHELADQGHEVHVITTFRNGGTETPTSDGPVQIHRLPDARFYLGSAGSAFSLDQMTFNLALRRHADLLATSDVVHAFLPIVNRFFETPLVAHFHHWDEPEKPVEFLYRPTSNALWKRTYRTADAVASISNYSAEALIERGIDRDTIWTVPNGVDVDTYHPGAGVEPDIPDWERILLFVGPLVERKGLRYLIDALPDILAAHPNTGLVLVGDGNQERIAARARDQGVREHVTFAGFVDDEALPGYYTAADLFVFPTLLEGFGMVLIEAMASKLPVVTTTAAAVPEVVGDAGRTVPPRSSDAFATAVNAVLNDPDLAAELGEAGYQRVHERFTWTQATKRLVELYESVI